jgi:hypothetical protein
MASRHAYHWIQACLCAGDCYRGYNQFNKPSELCIYKEQVPKTLKECCQPLLNIGSYRDQKGKNMKIKSAMVIQVISIRCYIGPFYVSN